MEKEYKTYATVFFAGNRVSFNFVEWSLTGQIPTDYSFSVPIFGDAINTHTIVNQVFSTAESEMNWQFISDGVLFSPNVRSGFGVDEFQIVLTPENHEKAIEPEGATQKLNDKKLWKGLLAFLEARKLDDLMYVQANTTSITIWRFKKGLKEPFNGTHVKSDTDQQDIKVSTMKVDWKDIENKTKNETFQRIRKFFTVGLPEKELKDTWANLMFSPKLHYESSLAKDILRADLTANLNSIRTSSPKSINDFGAIPGKKSVLICTGDLAVSLEKSHLLLALIDGLGLYGNLKILIDDRDIFESMLNINTENDGRYSQNIEKLISNKYTLISAMPVGNGEQDEIVLRGTLVSDFASKEVFGLRNRIHIFNIEEPSSFEVNPVKVKNIGGVEGDLIHHNLTGKVILDTRDHDEVFYGPDPKDNIKKVNLWLSGLK